MPGFGGGRISSCRPSWCDTAGYDSSVDDSFRTLKLSIASLDLLMVALLYVTLENASSGGLVEAGSLQDMGGIDPVVRLSAHNMLPLGFRTGELKLPYWILRRVDEVSKGLG